MSLKSIQGIGNLLFKRLIDHFNTPEAVLGAPVSRLQEVKGVSARIARAIAGHTPPDSIFKEIEQVKKKGYHIVTLRDGVYPEMLRHIPDPPPVLYTYGKLESMFCPISIVGSRKATRYGLEATRRLSSELAQMGVHVVSGMARGIDTAAHWGAIEEKGRTIAVLGSGLNHIYPAENLKLFHKIAENGCVVTEFCMDAAPEAHHFPMRNRIISGISLGTVVVEAARKSGSLITARLSADQNREVFAVPGNINASTAKGTHDLIKQGAKLVENAKDILEEIAPQLAGKSIRNQRCPALPAMSAEEKTLFDQIDTYPIHIDTLARRLSANVGKLTALLSRLEILGVIQQEPGKYFVRHQDYIDG